MDAVQCGCRNALEGSGGSSSSKSGRVSDLRQPIDLGAGGEGMDSLIQDEICADEAGWLDIMENVKAVKSQVVDLIFNDLIDEMSAEIQDLWSG